MLASRHMAGPPAMCKFLPELILNELFLISSEPGCDVNLSALLDVLCSPTILGSRYSSRISKWENPQPSRIQNSRLMLPSCVLQKDAIIAEPWPMGRKAVFHYNMPELS